LAVKHPVTMAGLGAISPLPSFRT